MISIPSPQPLIEPSPPGRSKAESLRAALVSNPNAGKTTLFNALTGLRAQTANFPGTTIEVRRGRMRLADGAAVELIDMPGLYSLTAATAEERVALDDLLGRNRRGRRPDAIILILDATNLRRNLYLASHALELGVPVVAALNMIDLAEKNGARIDAAALARELGCPVVPMAARSGRGLSDFRDALSRLHAELRSGPVGVPSPPRRFDPREEHRRYDWADEVGQRCTQTSPSEDSGLREKVDRVLTHPVWGVAAFAVVMLGMFYLVFSLANVPMAWIDRLFGLLGAGAARLLPAGQFRDLIVNGVIAGVGGVLVFLPQICILFFVISLLEDTGYLARAASVMDRVMRRVGLPGKAFVPMLSAHACAVPAVMASRVIENRRERLLTILTLPLMSCSARLPIYAMITALLFPRDPLRGALVFTAAYGLGLAAAFAMAGIFNRTLLRGRPNPLMLELPSYKWPSLKTALLTTWDRATVFLKNAGTLIFAVAIVVWWLSSYPRMDAGDLPAAARSDIGQWRATAAALAADGETARAGALQEKADRAWTQQAAGFSFAGRLGRFIEPAIAPLGFDWKIGVGVLSSFAAREVIVATLAVMYGVGEEGGGEALIERLHSAQRSDGSPVFTPPVCASLLVFYVLAMQCFSTLIVTGRETRSWRWPLLQFSYMGILAYGAAFVAYRIGIALGGGG